MNAYWHAANYLSVGQIYLLDNPLLKIPLQRAHIKPRLLGHWGTTPGLNFIYVHMNRMIKRHDLSMFFVAGPGHGGPAIVANTWLEGTYSKPDVVPVAAGDVPTLEMLAAIDILRKLTPELKIRFINVLDLMTLQPQEDHPHGLSSKEFDSLFTTDKPIIFAYHG